MSNELFNLKAELITIKNNSTKGKINERIKANNSLFVYSNLKPILKAALIKQFSK
jgi:hypothetical protein